MRDAESIIAGRLAGLLSNSSPVAA